MLGIHARMVFWKHGVKSGLSVCIERFESWRKKNETVINREAEALPTGTSA